MKKTKKVLSAIIAGAMALSMSATAFAAEMEDNIAIEATNKDGKSADNDLVIAIEGSVSSLDPDNIPDTNAISATRGMYEMLVRFDENQEIVSGLADTWEVSEDSLIYTFHLREGIKFHDGTDFNAQAVVANYDRVVDVENNLRTRRTFVTTKNEEEFYRCASVEAADDYTVVFTLAEPYSTFINKLTQFCIISPAAIEEYGNDIMYHPCGTGPFKFEEWVEGDHTTMVKNEEYWGEPASVDSVTIREVPEAGSRTAMLQTGEADMIYPTAADQLSVLEGAGDVDVHAVTSNIMRYVTLNTNVEALSDVRVRQAMNYAIDKNAYCQVMYSGYGTPATSAAPNCILYYQEQTPYDYDLEKAKSLLEEAGYADGFDLTIWGDNTTQEIKGMTFIKQQLEQIGINVEVLPMDPATVSDKIYVPLEDAEINMWYVNWSASDFSMDGSLRSLLYSTMCPPTSANTVYYNNADFDKLMDDALATADTGKLADLYGQAQKIAWDDAVWLFLGNDQLLYSTKSYLSGAYVAPDGCISFAGAVLAQ